MYFECITTFHFFKQAFVKHEGDYDFNGFNCRNTLKSKFSSYLKVHLLDIHVKEMNVINSLLKSF